LSGAPRVSILLPARNEAEHLPAALADLAAQTYADFETLILDDGSTDATGKLAADFATRDERFVHLPLAAAGIVAALNTGLDRARGSLIARMDADDRCAPERLARQLALLDARPEIGLASCLIAPPPEQTWAGGYGVYGEWVNSLTEPAAIECERFVECPIVHPTLVVRRALLETHGGWRHGDFPEDYELILRLLDAGVAMAKVPEALYFWRDHPNRASRTDPRYRPEAFFRLKATHLVAGPLRDKREVIIWGAGRVSRRHARPLIELGVSVRAWVDVDPKKIGQVVNGVPVIAPDDAAAFADLPFLAQVGSRGAREIIRLQWRKLDRVEGVDAWMCA
jgi:glycosyltransferase involved in cell wall biosynthesis